MKMFGRTRYGAAHSLCMGITGGAAFLIMLVLAVELKVTAVIILSSVGLALVVTLSAIDCLVSKCIQWQIEEMEATDASVPPSTDQR